MKKYILVILGIFIDLIGFAQKFERKDSIQICYETGRASSLISGRDHCITIWFENDLIFGKRICYSISNFNPKCVDTSLKFDANYGLILDEDYTFERYNQSEKSKILCRYRENDNYLIIDELVEISKSQLDECIKILNEIKAFAPKIENSVQMIINPGRNSYVITDQNGTIVVIDWYGRYDRSRDIEKALGLKSYSRCPCLEKDIEQMKSNHRKNQSR